MKTSSILALSLAAAVVSGATTPAAARTRILMTPPATTGWKLTDILVSSFNTCASPATYKVSYIRAGDGSVLKAKTGRVASNRSFTDSLAGGLPANTTLVIKLEHSCTDGTSKAPLATVTYGRASADGYQDRLGNFEIQD